MAWFSILPESLYGLETGVIRLFLVLGVLTIGPWALFLLYDFVLYVWRSATYEVPHIGGRARGRARPRAPSLSERPSGRPRVLSFPGQGRIAEASGMKPDREGEVRMRYQEGNDINGQGVKY